MQLHRTKKLVANSPHARTFFLERKHSCTTRLRLLAYNRRHFTGVQYSRSRGDATMIAKLEAHSVRTGELAWSRQMQACLSSGAKAFHCVWCLTTV